MGKLTCMELQRNIKYIRVFTKFDIFFIAFVVTNVQMASVNNQKNHPIKRAAL